MFIIDHQGYLIADSQNDFSNNYTPVFEEYFPSAYAIMPTEAVDELIEIGHANDDGIFEYLDDNGETHQLVYKELPTFGWILAYDETENLILSEHTTFLGNIQISLVIITTFITSISLLIVFVIANKITKPILNLRKATYSMIGGDFDVEIDTSGNDELSDLSKSFKKMSQSIKQIISLEKELAVEKQKVKSERLSAIGELASRLSHDIRNPLNIIQMAMDNLQKMYGQEKKTELTFLRVSKAVDRISHQIESVLDFVRFVPPKMQDHSIKEILESSISMVKIPDNVKLNIPNNDAIVSCDDRQSSISTVVSLSCSVILIVIFPSSLPIACTEFWIKL